MPPEEVTLPPQPAKTREITSSERRRRTIQTRIVNKKHKRHYEWISYLPDPLGFEKYITVFAGMWIERAPRCAC